MPAFQYVDPPDPFLPENQFQGWLNRPSKPTSNPRPTRPQDTPVPILSSAPAPPVELPSPPPRPHILDPYLAALGKPLHQAQSQRTSQSRIVASTPATRSASRVSTAPAKKTQTMREVAREKKLRAKRREVEDLETQMERLAARLEEAKRGVGELESGGWEERAVPLVVQVERRKERYRGFRRIWGDMSDDDRFWYYVECEESKIVE